MDVPGELEIAQTDATEDVRARLLRRAIALSVVGIMLSEWRSFITARHIYSKSESKPAL